MFKSKKKKEAEILSQFKKAKDSSFDFERIALFFQRTDKSDASQVLSDRTLNDLDFEELFMHLDRTQSAIGQQFLYSLLRTLPKTSDRTLELEQLIQKLHSNEKTKEQVVLALNQLNQPGAYFLQRLLFEKNIDKPKWFWMIPILSNASLLLILISFFKPLAFFFAIPVLVINSIIHIWNKNNIIGYSNSIPQLLLLNKIATNLAKFGVLDDASDETKTALNTLKKILKNTALLKWESSSSDDAFSQIGEYGLDLIKGFFLLEPILFFKLLKKIESQRRELLTVFVAVAKIDAALSISSWRESLPYFCKPEFSNSHASFTAKDLYHPLIPKPISNDFSISNDKSVLLSGSNMSGKTTFIRTIGINTLLAQTTNTALATHFCIPRFKIHSAIRISDNLLDDTSYYYEEVKAIKQLIEESEKQDFNLFLLDELFKGTNTVERIASGKAVLSHLHRPKSLVFCSTHDIELMSFLGAHYNYYHFSETIQNQLLKFDYKLKEGSVTQTNAIRILELNDFPEQITKEAKALAQVLDEMKRQQMKS